MGECGCGQEAPDVRFPGPAGVTYALERVGRAMTDLGFVVIEWNQASGRPQVSSDDVYPTAAGAELAADVARRETLRVGRRERYTVARVEGLGHE